jgi:hypothetical protein
MDVTFWFVSVYDTAYWPLHVCERPESNFMAKGKNFTYVSPVCVTITFNIIISHTHQSIIQYNYISGLHVSTVFSHHQALLRASPRLI